ncbi:general odorant-binding protein 71 [Aricia agestis]|uniref:general odorant-binding protein 71 n=1 Tax=Aricia agestis TaxID=91739 RepID=UPI001C20706A|nr:general odorant-binding protein 71 [Aricia agestis]
MTRLRCLIFFCFFLGCHGLSCRSEGGYKDTDLKRMYNTCLKQQNNSSSDNRQEEWSDRGIWNNDRTSYRGDRYDRGNRGRNRDENEDRESRDRYGDSDSRSNSNDRYNMDRRDRNSMNSRDNNYNMNSRDNNGYGNNDENRQNSRLNGRDEFLQSEEYDNDNSRTYHNQYNRRNKRERRVEMNSGQRSQYNPNSKNRGSDSSDSRNSSSSQDKACALHCLMENLHMTGDNGMPDRYLVTHAITRDVRNEDLRDFLQESIEECFQILANENTEDKCEFSRNILICLSEKGKANCDDWKDDFQF